MDDCVGQFLAQMDTGDEAGVDVRTWFSQLAFDILAELSFSKFFGTLGGSKPGRLYSVGRTCHINAKQHQYHYWPYRRSPGIYLDHQHKGDFYIPVVFVRCCQRYPVLRWMLWVSITAPNPLKGIRRCRKFQPRSIRSVRTCVQLSEEEEEEEGENGFSG